MVSVPRPSEHSQLWSWLLLFVVAGLIAGMGLLHYYFVEDRPRHWDFGALPMTPGASAYSTRRPPSRGAVVPHQIQRLPEAVPTEAARVRALREGARP